MNVSPEDIAGFYDFVPVDGVLPIDRMAQANLWKEIMAGAMRMPPQIIQQYDWSRIFAWTAVIGGLKNITQFRVQMVPDAQLQQGVQAGNVIPMPQRPGLPAPAAPNPGVGRPSSATTSGLNALAPPQPGGGQGGY